MLFVVHYFEIYNLTEIVDNYGSYLSVSVIWGNAMSFLIYIGGFIAKKTERMTGNHIYDFFMGS
jgi:Delta24(24(1))-sterol reductase